MAKFNTVFDEAKQVIRAWDGFSNCSEITIVRDAFGDLLFLFSGQRPSDESSLRQSLDSQVAPYKVKRMLWEEESCNDILHSMKQEICHNRVVDEQDGACTWFRLERTLAKKAWIDRSKNVVPIWPYDDTQNGRRPKVVAFYSFKGGMGRTTALAAVALLLAKRGRHVLAIDTDIEAPGLSSLFFPDDHIHKGTVDFFLEKSTAVDMNEYLLQFSDPVMSEDLSGKIFVIPAGIIDKEYLQKLGRVDCQDVVPDNMRKCLTKLIQMALDKILATGVVIDYILLDARAGFHDMSGVTAAHLPHAAILFGRDNRQSWSGLEQVVSALACSQSEPLPIAFVDSMYASSEDSPSRRHHFKLTAYTLCCECYYSEIEEPEPSLEAEDEAHSPIYVPYQTLLTRDFALYSDGSTERDEEVQRIKGVLFQESYRQIESRVRQWFGDIQTEGGENNENGKG